MSRATFPSKESRELYVDLANVLESYGITEYDLGKGGIHPYIIFKVKDHTYKYPFPGTGSDWRGAKNARATLINKLREMNLTPIAELEPEAPEPAQERLTPADAFAEQDDIIVATAPVEPRQPEKAPEQVQQAPTEPPVPEPPVVERPLEPPLRDAGATVWDDETLVQFAANQGLLYLSLPQHPVMVFELDVDLVAEKGSKLIVDPVVQKVRVIPKNMIELMYRPLPKETSLREAMKLVMRSPTAPAAPEPPKPQERAESEPPKVEEPPEVVVEQQPKRRSKGSVHGLGLMLGRVLVALDYIQHTYRTDKVETSQVVEVLDKDKPGSIASQVSFAVTKKFIYVVGPVPGRRGNYYRLTDLGRKKARLVGDEPFTMVGMKPPSRIAMAAE